MGPLLRSGAGQQSFIFGPYQNDALCLVDVLRGRSTATLARQMDRDELIDRIRRLLRLAESPNVHEAATAAAMAQRLMTRHRIDAASATDDPDAGIEDQRDSPLDESKRLRPWKIELAAVLANENGCRIYVLEGKKVDSVILVGRREDADLVRILYPELVRRVESLARSHGAGRDRDFCNGIRLGAVTTIAERLRIANRDATTLPNDDDEGATLDSSSMSPNSDSSTSNSSTGASLSLSRLEERDAAVDRFIERTMHLRPGKSRSLRADAEGYAVGRVAGNVIGLERAARR